MNKECRFRILNDKLGYGNSDAKIIFIGIEERGSWELKELTEDSRTLEFLDKLNDDSIEEKVKKVKEEFGHDFDIQVDNILEKIKSLTTNFVEECESNGKTLENTAKKQFKLSKEILCLNGNTPNGIDWDNYGKNLFGTKNGNETCLNYFPIARDSESHFYPEEQYFFGTPFKNKFYNNNYETIRIENFIKFLNKINDRMKNENIFIFLMGTDVYKNMETIIGEVFKIDFNEKNNNHKVHLKNGDMFYINKDYMNGKIWSTYHPRYYKFYQKDIIDTLKNIFNK